MVQYIDLDLQLLIDLLVTHTNEYTKMLSFNTCTVEEFAQCKLVLAEIQQATKVKLEQGGYLTNNIVPDLPDYIINLPDRPANIDSKEQ